MIGKKSTRALTLSAVSAIALGAYAEDAFAAEWEISIGGYAEQMLGYSSINGPFGRDLDGIDLSGSAEIYFNPSITLDNGIKFSARMDFEGVGNTNGNSDAEIDDAFLQIQGSFGSLRLGVDDNVTNEMHVPAPGKFLPGSSIADFQDISRGTISTYIPIEGFYPGTMRRTGNDFFRGTLGSTFLENGVDEQSPRITYFTPRFAGFQLGVSYAPDTDDSRAPGVEEEFSAALRYAGEFGAIRVAAGVGYSVANDKLDPLAKPETFNFGLNLGYGNFTIGGSWAEQTGTSWTAQDGEAYSFGAAYSVGQWGFGLNYFRGQNVDDEHLGFGPKETFCSLQLTAAYELSQADGTGNVFTNGTFKSARLVTTIAAFEFREDVGDPGFGTRGDNFDGFVIGTGISLDF